jgi:hypothetical protein
MPESSNILIFPYGYVQDPSNQLIKTPVQTFGLNLESADHWPSFKVCPSNVPRD